MRLICAAVCALALGCVSPGLTLEVTTSDPAIKRVELFVGDACDHTCPAGVAPPGLGMLLAEAYLVADPQPWTASVSDGIAGFVLQAESNTYVPIIVAIGFDAAEGGNARAVATLHDALVSAGDAAYWRVPLVSAGTLDAAPPVAGTERVAVWRQPQAPGLACVMVEHGSDGREVIVPSDDTDCDLLTIGECAPWTHLATDAPSTLDSAQCLLTTAFNGSTEVCTFGGPTCSEVGGTTRACEPLDRPYCAPSAFCQSCSPWNVDCIVAQINTLGGLPAIDCHVPVGADGNPCNGTSETRAAISAEPWFTNSTTRCADVTFNDLDTPLGAFDRYLPIDEGKLELQNLAQPCGFELVLKGKLTQGSRAAAYLTDIALSNGKHLIAPLRVTFVVGDMCGQPPSCQVSTITDSMFACIDRTATPSACAGQLGCNGPMCGTKCCTTGEMCINGECRCGSGPGCVAGEECARGMVAPGCGAECCDGFTVSCTF